MNLVATILTSAVVSAIVTQLMALWGQKLDRAARREDMLFQSALDMAKTRNERFIALMDSMDVDKYQMQDDVVSAEKYYEWLKHLRQHGRLPNDDMIERLGADGNIAE